MVESLKEKINLKKLNLLSINQINAQSKLSEVWKSLNTDGYLTKWETSKEKTDSRTRIKQKQSPNEPGRSKKMTST